jgi:4-hydroxyphenylpyruvate dioxygenase-like putative hemolysin
MSQHDIPLRRIDHVKLFVGNARQSAYFYRNAFGFDVVAYEGLETRVRHEAGYVLKQGQIAFVLVSPLSGQHPESQRLVRHGDGVMDIARRCWRMRPASTSSRRFAPMATRRILSSTATDIAASSPLVTSRSIPTAIARARGTRSGSRQSTTSSAMSKKGR